MIAWTNQDLDPMFWGQIFGYDIFCSDTLNKSRRGGLQHLGCHREKEGSNDQITSTFMVGNDAKIGWYYIRTNDQNRMILVICFS